MRMPSSSLVALVLPCLLLSLIPVESFGLLTKLWAGVYERNGNNQQQQQHPQPPRICIQRVPMPFPVQVPIQVPVPVKIHIKVPVKEPVPFPVRINVPQPFPIPIPIMQPAPTPQTTPIPPPTLPPPPPPMPCIRCPPIVIRQRFLQPFIQQQVFTTRRPRPRQPDPHIQQEYLHEPQGPGYDLDADHETGGKSVHDSRFSYSNIGQVAGDTFEDEDDYQQQQQQQLIDPRSSNFMNYNRIQREIDRDQKGIRKEVPIISGGFQMTKEYGGERNRRPMGYGWPSSPNQGLNCCRQSICC